MLAEATLPAYASRMIRRLSTSIALCLGLVLLGSTTAHAAGEPLPGGFYDDGMTGFSNPGPPPAFIAMFVIVVIGGVATTIWRVSLARQMARRSGMDPGEATAVTLLSDDGLDAAYLASNLRPSTTAEPSAPAPGRSAQERLRELEQLRDEGLITTGEYEARRKAIVDSI